MVAAHINYMNEQIYVLYSIDIDVVLYIYIYNMYMYSLAKRKTFFLQVSVPKRAAVPFARQLNAADAEYNLLPGRQVHRLHVEDPFIARNLNCVLSPENEERCTEWAVY